MQNELKSLERRWGLAVQTARFGVWDLEPQAHHVHYPPDWKAMLGYEASGAPDATSVRRERVHPDDLGPMLTRWPPTSRAAARTASASSTCVPPPAAGAGCRRAGVSSNVPTTVPHAAWSARSPT